MFDHLFDPEIRQKAHRFHLKRRIARITSLFYNLLFILVIFMTPAARRLAVFTGTQRTRFWLFLVLIMTIYFLGNSVIGYFLGYRMQRRFDLSTQGTGSWLGDQLKGFVIALVLVIPILLLIHRLIMQSPEVWWLQAGIGWVIFSVVLSNLAPVLIMPLFFRFTPLADPELRTSLERLFEKAGTSIRGVFVMNMSSKTRAANAMITGTGNTRRMVLGDTLVSQYSPDEIEVVMAHELGHHRLHHLPKLLLFNGLAGLAAFWLVKLTAESFAVRLGYAGITDPAFLPMVLFMTGFFLSLIDPLEKAYSRKIEKQSDQYALDLTKKPDAFITAMARLADQNLAVLQPSLWEEILFYDHPPIGQRIQMADANRQSGMQAGA